MSTYRYMTALDVAYSLFSPKSLTHVRSILTRLSGGTDYKERECLFRFPWPSAKAGNRERIFTLGASGREIVQRLGMVKKPGKNVCTNVWKTLVAKGLNTV